jgi:preprotein translocase subunit SecA
MFEGLSKIFARRSLAPLEEKVSDINALEAEVHSLGPEALAVESAKLKERAAQGESPDELLPRAFALVREAAERSLGLRPFDVQLVGGMVLNKGAVAEMMTGEGKTLAAVAPAYLNALTGKGVHIVTVNEYLARRDAVWMGQIYRTLGLSVACIVPNGAYLYDPEYKAPEEGSGRAAQNPEESKLLDKERDTTGSFLVQSEFLRPVSRREAYLADVTYGTNHEFGFDYLRDNLTYRLTDQVQRGHPFAIIDEVDSILIDEARTPLIIAAPDAQSSEFYKTFARLAAMLDPETDYEVDEKKKTASISDEGIEKVEKMLGLGNLYAPENIRLVHFLEESVKARALFHRDRDYVVKNGEVIIVDEFTGRLLLGRRYQAGLHQAIEAKEGVVVKEESRTYAKVSIQNYFRLYSKISGMTGTAQTSAEEFHKVYGLDVISIPPNKPCVRRDLHDVIYKDFRAKVDAVVRAVAELRKAGQPVLLGTTSISKNEIFSAALSKAGIPHEVLNAKNNEREGAIIAQAGRPGAVTVATNMAGRGVDILLGGNPPTPAEAEKVRASGGLHVLGTERHEARRIDNQLRGRGGRQGDPGSSQFFLSLDDDLLRLFGGERVKGLMERFQLPEDQPIELGFLSKTVAQAQEKVEGHNFDLRKHLLEYDDVLNKQRSAVYKRRREILEALDKETLGTLISTAVSDYLQAAWPQITAPEPVGEEAKEPVPTKEKIGKIFKEVGLIEEESELPSDPESAANYADLVERRSLEIAEHPFAKSQLLGILDMLWMNNLEDLEALSESVGLRAYGQRDPLVEYRQEASRLYRSFWGNFNGWVFGNIFKLANVPAATRSSSTSGEGQGGGFVRAQTVDGAKAGRNSPCPCGAKNSDGTPKKYKHCGLLNTEEHQKNMAGGRPKHEVMG